MLDVDKIWIKMLVKKNDFMQGCLFSWNHLLFCWPEETNLVKTQILWRKFMIIISACSDSFYLYSQHPSLYKSKFSCFRLWIRVNNMRCALDSLILILYCLFLFILLRPSQPIFAGWSNSHKSYKMVS